ncbi:hypothetical protein V6N13_065712 [Hibiscus sabdariffa]
MAVNFFWSLFTSANIATDGYVTRGRFPLVEASVLAHLGDSVTEAEIAFSLLTDREALWVRFIRAKYKVLDGVPIQLKGSNGSRLWKGLGMIWEDIRHNIVWRVGSGERVTFWFDCWIKDLGPLVNHAMVRNVQSLPMISVADMVDMEGNWRWAEIDQVLPSYVLLCLAAIKGHLSSFCG